MHNVRGQRLNGLNTSASAAHQTTYPGSEHLKLTLLHSVQAPLHSSGTGSTQHTRAQSWQGHPQALADQTQ